MQYDTIIIGSWKRTSLSLNIDFLLGYLKELLPRRPDLKIISRPRLSTGTQRTAPYNNAPIIGSPVRTYPVSALSPDC